MEGQLGDFPGKVLGEETYHRECAEEAALNRMAERGGPDVRVEDEAEDGEEGKSADEDEVEEEGYNGEPV